MLTIVQKGDFRKLNSFLERCKEVAKLGDLDKYGRMGVRALESATPKDTGLARKSWSYKITRKQGSAIIEWHNDDIENGYPVVIGLQYGHATKSGSWVEGIDFVNPALKDVFEDISKQALQEVFDS